MVALNAELQGNDGSERQLRCDDGSEHQSGNVTLNVKLGSDDDGFERRNREWMVAVIAKIGNANRNVKLGSDDDGSERRN